MFKFEGLSLEPSRICNLVVIDESLCLACPVEVAFARFCGRLAALIAVQILRLCAYLLTPRPWQLFSYEGQITDAELKILQMGCRF